MILTYFLVYALYAYLLTGLLFATWFVLKGVNSIDEGMNHVSWGVRLLLIPGSILLWVVLLRKYLKTKPSNP
jgi:hypothetical protein